jgi:hypothetical protein
MKKLKKTHYLTIISKKIPKKSFEKVAIHLHMLHPCKILHKENYKIFQTIFFSILCCKDVGSKHPKGDLGVNGNLLI